MMVAYEEYIAVVLVSIVCIVGYVLLMRVCGFLHLSSFCCVGCCINGYTLTSSKWRNRNGISGVGLTASKLRRGGLEPKGEYIYAAINEIIVFTGLHPVVPGSALEEVYLDVILYSQILEYTKSSHLAFVNTEKVRTQRYVSLNLVEFPVLFVMADKAWGPHWLNVIPLHHDPVSVGLCDDTDVSKGFQYLRI
jgi:hypothetical protein